MRAWLLAGLLALLLPSQGWAAGAHVQSCKDDTGTSTTFACTITVTAGNGLAVFAANASTGNTLTSIRDGVNTYESPAGCTADLGARHMRYALNIAGGSTTITVVWGSSNNAVLIVHEFSGANTFDTCAGINSQTNPGTGTDAVTSTAATTSDGAYIFAATAQNCCVGGTITQGTNFTIREQGNDSTFLASSESWDQTTGASTAGTFTVNQAASVHRTGMMAFKQAGASILQPQSFPFFILQ